MLSNEQRLKQSRRNKKLRFSLAKEDRRELASHDPGTAFTPSLWSTLKGR